MFVAEISLLGVTKKTIGYTCFGETFLLPLSVTESQETFAFSNVIPTNKRFVLDIKIAF